MLIVMTEKQKAEAYDRALDKARSALKDGTITSTAIAYLQDIFPELKECDDEKIKTAILNHLKKMWGNGQDNICDVHVEDAIDWLEKQNEIEIPFGAKDSELQEATYYIPKGFHAEINDDKVVIKKGEKPAKWSKDDEKICQCLIRDQEKALDDVRNDKYGHSEIISDLKEMYRNRIDWLKSLKNKCISQKDI